jgi:hypothetical protein
MIIIARYQCRSIGARYLYRDMIHHERINKTFYLERIIYLKNGHKCKYPVGEFNNTDVSQKR